MSAVAAVAGEKRRREIDGTNDEPHVASGVNDEPHPHVASGANDEPLSKVAKVRQEAEQRAFLSVQEPRPTNATAQVGNYFDGSGNRQSFLPVAKAQTLPASASADKKKRFAVLQETLAEWMFLFENYRKGEYFDDGYPRQFKHITPPEIWRDHIENADDINSEDCTDDRAVWNAAAAATRQTFLQENANYKQTVNEGLDKVLTQIGRLLFQ